MITSSGLYHILSAVVPLYVSMILAYVSVKWWKIFTPEQCAGINKFIALFSIPLFSFDFISSINFHDMNLRFIVADTLQKLVVLLSLFIWAKFTRKGSLEWSITLFSLSTLPNTLVLGIPLCKSMYGDFSTSLMIQVVFLQVLIWNNFLIILYEYRATRMLFDERFPENVGSVEVASDVHSLDGRELLETEAEMGEDGMVHVKLRKSASCNSRVSRVGGEDGRVHVILRKDVHLVARSLSTSALADFRVGGGSSAIVPQCGLDLHGVEEYPKDYENHGPDQLGTGTRPDANKPYGLGPPPSKWASGPGDFQDRLGVSGPKPTSKPPTRVMTKLILTMVWRKMMWNPNAYASVIGLIWALISFKLHIKMPEMVAGSIEILSKTGLGMAMFSLGLFMALQPKIIVCGKTMTTLTLAVRLVISPLIMAGTSLVVGLRGVLLQVAIVQAALPQAVAPFVFAKQYNIHAEILSTGVIFGMLISLPFTIAYYILLGLIK